MKTTILLLLFFVTATCLHPQNISDTSNNRFAEPGSLKEYYPKNDIKTNVTGMALFGTYGFFYERMLSRKISVAGGYRTMPAKQISDFPFADKITNDDIKTSSASSNAFTLEFRKYTGKHAGARGFYVSVYGRYANFKVDYPYTFTAEDNQVYDIPIHANLHGIGGGFMLGAQWLIAKHVVLDLFFLGSHYGSLNGTGSSVKDLSGLSENDKQALQQDINSLVASGDKQYISSTVNNNGITATAKGPFVGMRAGISLGIAF